MKSGATGNRAEIDSGAGVISDDSTIGRSQSSPMVKWGSAFGIRFI